MPVGPLAPQPAAPEPSQTAAPEAALTCPVRMVSLSDDASVPPNAVARLAEIYG